MQKELENKIELHFTNKQINQSFIIIDDQLILSTHQNFNFAAIYGQKNIILDANIHQYLTI
ncbi:MAG: hypothetical protein MJ219_03005 [Mycoplasmoidaceae bacterium]|nr:hypothetical protein [Mycoplasmoidaceae bacterium]